MSRYYEHYPPPPLGDFIIPKGKRPNVQFNELIVLESGEILRNPIGLGFSRTPIIHPFVCETHLGVIEVVGLPDSYQGKPELPRGSEPPQSSHLKPSTIKGSNNRCPYQH